MRTTLEPMLALFNLGGGEIILLLAILLIFALVAVVLGIIIFVIARPRGKSAPVVPPTAPIMPPPTPGGGTEVIPRKCPKCGADLKSDAPEGLCPACLLQRGFATEGGALPGTPPFTPP